MNKPRAARVRLRLQPGFDALGGFHAALIQRLPEFGRVLDLGCGANQQLARYRREWREVWGTDFASHPELEEPVWFRPLGTGGAIPFADQTFDTVASTWVLEHVDQPVGFLKEVCRVLKPGGSYVALTPHGDHYLTWLIRLLDHLPHRLTQLLVHKLYGRPLHDTFPTYYSLNTLSQWASAAVRSGLTLTDVAGFANPDYFAFHPFLRRSAIALDRWLDRVHPGLGRLYTVVSFRKELGTAVRSAEDAVPAGSLIGHLLGSRHRGKVGDAISA